MRGVWVGLAAADQHLKEDQELRERLARLEGELASVQAQLATAKAAAPQRGW